MAKKKWYTVIVGKKTGVFDDWTEVGPLVLNVPGAIHNGYTSEHEAWDAYNAARDRGDVRVVTVECSKKKNKKKNTPPRSFDAPPCMSPQASSGPSAAETAYITPSSSPKRSEHLPLDDNGSDQGSSNGTGGSVETSSSPPTGVTHPNVPNINHESVSGNTAFPAPRSPPPVLATQKSPSSRSTLSYMTDPDLHKPATSLKQSSGSQKSATSPSKKSPPQSNKSDPPPPVLSDVVRSPARSSSSSSTSPSTDTMNIVSVSPFVNTQPRRVRVGSPKGSRSSSSSSSTSSSSASTRSTLFDSAAPNDRDFIRPIVRVGTPSDLESLPGRSDNEADDKLGFSPPSSISTGHFYTPPTSPRSVASASPTPKAKKGKARERQVASSPKHNVPGRSSPSTSSSTNYGNSPTGGDLSPLLTSPQLYTHEEVSLSSASTNSPKASSSKRQLSNRHRVETWQGETGDSKFLSVLGFSIPPHSPVIIHDDSNRDSPSAKEKDKKDKNRTGPKDPRSPIRSGTALPVPANLASFGRPSPPPQVPQSISSLFISL